MTRIEITRLFFALSLLCLYPTLLPASLRPMEDESGPEIPQWILDDWAARTEGQGVWIADNATYKSEQEPFDAYGIQWEYGLGEKHLKGRLYCIKDGKEIVTVWQFTEYWDPATEEVRVVQIGGNGTVGLGKLWRDADGRIKEQQTFASPEGGSFESGHLLWMENGEQHTQSYNIVDGEWKEERYYRWKPTPGPAAADIPEVYQDVAYLIGEWELPLDESGSAKMTFTWAENQRMVKHENLFRTKAGVPFQLESEGIITYHGVKDQLVFLETYMDRNTQLIAEGYQEMGEDGTILRFFTCYYPEGETLPWSDGAVAPKGGKAIEFKQIWTPIDTDSFAGDFYWKQDGKWVHPIQKYDEPGYQAIWKRMK